MEQVRSCDGSQNALGSDESKRKGTRNEHRTMRLLEAAGYHCARAGGSLGVFDVVGIGSADIVLVQLKTRKVARSAHNGENAQQGI